MASLYAALAWTQVGLNACGLVLAVGALWGALRALRSVRHAPNGRRLFASCLVVSAGCLCGAHLGLGVAGATVAWYVRWEALPATVTAQALLRAGVLHLTSALLLAATAAELYARRAVRL